MPGRPFRLAELGHSITRILEHYQEEYIKDVGIGSNGIEIRAYGAWGSMRTVKTGQELDTARVFAAPESKKLAREMDMSRYKACGFDGGPWRNLHRAQPRVAVLLKAMRKRREVNYATSEVERIVGGT